jgi:hypothetical protein
MVELGFTALLADALSPYEKNNEDDDENQYDRSASYIHNEFSFLSYSYLSLREVPSIGTLGSER